MSGRAADDERAAAEAVQFSHLLVRNYSYLTNTIINYDTRTQLYTILHARFFVGEFACNVRAICIVQLMDF